MRRPVVICLAVFAGVGSIPALADLTDLPFVNPIEQAGARANQAVFDQLTGGQTPTCPQDIRTPTGACTGAVFEIFSNVRELVETANDISDSGPTDFSLGLDQENLGFALRWTAAEELAAQGSSATQFSNTQLNSLASRISALRFGARGGPSAFNATRGTIWAGRDRRAAGGGASADPDTGSIASRWGGFLDGSFGYGNKEDTTDPFNPAGSTGSEDAFDYDGQEGTVGVDYRLRDQFVIGGLLGYTKRRIDFDSAVSIVDAVIEADGESLILYALWENERYYVSGSLGGQWLTYDLSRRITYPSLNPIVASVDVTTRSKTKSDAVTATLNAGVTLYAHGWGMEPFFKADYQKITINDFTEAGASGFEFQFGDQDIKSFDIAAGFKLHYAMTPRFGVVVPYLRAELHKELEDKPRNISAVYSALPAANVTSAADFDLATNRRDDQFAIAAGGFSVVLAHGLQGFLQYQQVFGLDTIHDRTITGGIRLEF